MLNKVKYSGSGVPTSLVFAWRKHGLLSMDQSLGAQAAAGGVNAAKGLCSKKITLKLNDQYPVLLKINK
ncbi:hypothetical protein A0256_08915 [Mucilaginibacter sp. PAMC 26640]|nr:hypothetical protein A0256_08915 [Mucilaginibacter sp. PAMC 26640]